MTRISLWMTALILLALTVVEVAAEETEFSSVLDMSLSELMQVYVVKVGSLTETSRAKIPAAVTRIDQSDIQELGARSLLELLEITVPGLQVIRHHWELPHIGIRGITSDREDKVMIRVNGRVMNERTARGAITERDFPLMGDIKHIEVIRGAGSALYGLGAVSTVIDITTFSAASGRENSLSVRGGTGMDFYALDGNFTKIFDSGLGIYLHTEVADIKGASDDDAPLILASDMDNIHTGERVSRGNPFATDSRDGGGFEDKPFVKIHLGIDYEDAKFWLRFTKAGRQDATTYTRFNNLYFRDLNLQAVSGGTVRAEEPLLQIGYEQLTATLDQTHHLAHDIDLNWMVSYDRTDVVKSFPADLDTRKDAYGEDEFFAKILANFSPGVNSDLAVGTELSYEKFGVRTNDYEKFDADLDDADSPWSALTKSLLGEWQWRPHKDWTTFLGGRIDKNTYTDLLYSPRAAVVYSNDAVNTYKLLLTQSQRMIIAEEARRAELEGGSISDPEVLRSMELRYERAADTSFIGVSAFYIDLDVIGWDKDLMRTRSLGNQTQWGAELELDFSHGAHRFRFSQAYTKLIDFQLSGELLENTTYITAKPWGYGDDLADWGTHTSKLWYSYQINPKTRFTSTLRALWGFDGSRDYGEKYIDDFEKENLNDRRRFIEPGWEKSYREQIFLNCGLQYKPSPATTFTINIHNALGLIDKDFNKRTYRNSQGDYRSEAVGVSAALTIPF